MERIIKIYNEAWLDGDIQGAGLFPLQLQLLRERLRNICGYNYSDEEIRLTWKSFFAAKYPPKPKCDRGYSRIIIIENECKKN
jgi:hypothetical protein